MLTGQLLLLALQSIAGQATPPRPIDPGSWVQADDYPLEAAEFGLAGKVRFRLAVDPQGRVTGCQILQSAGAELDSASCRILAQRARFEPARDVSGRALASIYESQINWTVPEDAPVPFAPAARFSESWTPLAGGRPWCHVTAFGKLPLSVPFPDCVPGSIRAAKPPRGRYITLRTATMLLPSGQAAPFRTKLKGRVYSRERYLLAVDWRGVVVRCEPPGRRKPSPAVGGPDDCALLRKQGQPVFQPAAPGTPLREAVMESVSTSN